MKKVLLFILFTILASSLSYAAVIKGNVYDTSLDRLNNTIIEVNTNPQQTFVAKNSEFSFDLKKGEYTITAKYYENNQIVSSAKEDITVEDDSKEYLLDLILFPNLEQEQLLNGSMINFNEEKTASKWWFYGGIGLGIVVLVILLIIIFIAIKPKQKEAPTIDTELQKIIEFIRDNEGRTTQKDIRKAFPSSEAKISLMISELEAKGILQKIKKGRGNIIILKK